VAKVRQELSLDRPLYVQYSSYVSRALKGDLGRSIHSRQPVWQAIKEHFPATLELTVASLLLAGLVGIIVGVTSAVKQYSLFDHLTMLGALAGISMPIFWIGILLMWFFSLYLEWLPTGGRDILSRILYGGRVSMVVGFISVAVGLFFGGALGVIAGYFKPVDNLIMRLMDILLSFPAILLAIAVMTILGPGLVNVMIAVGVRSIPAYARVVRSTVLSIKELPYCEASVAMGASSLRTIATGILPNSFPPVLVYTTLQIGNAILLGAVLSYLGLGVQPPVPEWGAMVNEGRSWLQSAPLIATFPGLAIFLVVVAFNLIGDGLRDSLDVRLKEVR
jgi:ABC-type dipeptide/oligopeptide/nickel transport system permease subunit